MPEVRMSEQITGLRDGVPWPAKGGTVKVSADEAASLIAAGLAEETKPSKAPPGETADAPPSGEDADATPKRSRRK